MKAIRFHAPKDIRLDEIPEPVCGPEQVKIAPAYVGICGTDLHEYLGGPTFCPVSPHPVTGETIPVVLGHEFSGVVEDFGHRVEGLKKGQRVVVQPTIACGTCGACKSGAENACPKGGFVGLSGSGGALSEHVVVPKRRVLPIPDDIPLDVAATVEPLSVGWHAVVASPFQKGDSALIIGGGPVGLAVIQALRAKEAGLIIVSEVSSKRAEFAKEFGAHHIFNPLHTQIEDETAKLCPDGVDVVFDCAGVLAGIEVACKSVRAKGTVVNVAIWEKAVPFNPNLLVMRELRYLGVLGYVKKDFEEVIEAIHQGVLRPQKMITKKVQLEETVEKGMKALISDKENQVKVLVEVHPEA